MKDMVSIIIPVYNREMYIEECIQSIEAQSYQNYEIIIIDDGSSDRTVEICQDLARTEPRIKLYYGEHKGVSAARNVGLDAAQGEYVFFVDSDDVIHPMLLETLVEGLQKHDVHMGGTRGINIPEKHWVSYVKKMQNASNPSEVIHRSFEEALHEMFTTETPFSVMGGVIMRREWIGQTRYRRDLSIGEDFYFCYENLIKGTGAIFLEKKWYLNRLHDSNTSWDYSYTGFMTRLRRRQLTWESEARFGRMQHAKLQKNEIFGIYLNCLQHTGVFSEDGKKMRKTLKAYRKTLLPAMKLKTKLAFIAAVYLPVTALMINKIRK